MNLDIEPPSGWVRTTVGALRPTMKNGIYKQASAYADTGIACLRMYNIQSGAIVWRDIKRMVLAAREADEYRLRPGDLLVNRVNSRELVGKSAIITEGLEACVFESKNIRVRFQDATVNSKYVNFALLFRGRQFFGRNAQQTVGMASISQEQLAAFPLDLPPVMEQPRIVAAIEEQFARLDAAVASLLRARANLKRYRASVLSAATNGQLVPTEAELVRTSGVSCETGLELRKRILEDRRNGARFAGWSQSDPTAPELLIVRGLPEGWSTVTVEELTPKSRSCAYGVLQPGPEVIDGVPLVRVGDVDQGRVSVGPLKRIARAVANQYPRTKLQGGEVLITLVGTIGRTAVVPESLRGANVARAVGVIPVTEQILPAWVEIWFRNPDRIREMTGKAHEVARKTLNLEDVRSSVVGLPPLAEQHRIVAEAERRLSAVDEAEAAIVVNLRRAARLREAIFKRAFEGKLVPQDPADEPARVLIERIRAERTTTNGTARLSRPPVVPSTSTAQVPLPI